MDAPHPFVTGFRVFIAEHFPGPSGQVLAMLVAGSHASPDSPGFLFALFRSLGVIHALVLSGSQVQGLRDALDRAFDFVGLRTTWVKLTASLWAVWAFAHHCAFEPPLVRAACVASLERTGWDRRLVSAGALILHLVLFPSHWGSLSFWMSWFCAALLSLGRSWTWRLVGVSAVTQLAFFRLGWIRLESELWVLLVANVFVLLCLNPWVQRGLGFVILSWLVLWRFSELSWGWMAWICLPLDGVCRVILVALRLLV